MPAPTSRDVQFLYTLRVTRPGMLRDGPTAAEAAAVSAHAAWMADQVAAGHVLLAGRTRTDDPETLGIVLLCTADAQRAAALMAADPGVSSGVMQADLRPFTVAFAADQSAADG